MKIIQTLVYELHELSDKAKTKARDWYREATSGDSFYSDCVIEDATILASNMGIKIEHIYFSGFSSQGDGACFEGSFYSGDVKEGKVKENAPNDEELKRIANVFESLARRFPNLSFTSKHTGRYYHENSTDFEFQNTDEESNDIDVSYELQDEIKEVSKDFMRWIYKQLEKEYEHTQSDEYVDGEIEANEYTFTEDGKRFGN